MTESWRTVAYSQLASALLLGLATAIAPESPYWLVERGRWVSDQLFQSTLALGSLG